MGDIMGSGEVDRVDCSVRFYMWECVRVCVCYVYVCVLALLVGVVSHGKYQRGSYQMSKNMFVFFWH